MMPAVVVTGPRQAGKTTLCRHLLPGRRNYATLDEAAIAIAARENPRALLDAAPLTLDEVQREPRLLTDVKLAVDRDPAPGRFLLTGSANLLMMRRVSESLAGRASYLTVWPMTRREQRGLGRCGVWDDLLRLSDRDWLDLIASQPEEPDDWRAAARRGGYPAPALRLASGRTRARWFDGYERTYIGRDVRDLAEIASLTDYRRTMRAAVLRLGQVTNQTELGRDIGLPQPTVRRYLNLLETSYLLVRLPAYAVNRTKRLIKAPKLYWSDTGLALHLAGSPEPAGAHLENLILNDLLAWRDAAIRHAELCYWRTTTGAEVDFVIETPDRLLPIEVKATRTPRVRDARHLLTFRGEYGSKSHAGLLLHTGDRTEWIAPGVLAAPWWRVI